jgi:hypothetical protein
MAGPGGFARGNAAAPLKHQAPITKHQGNSKLQATSRKALTLEFEIWEFPWDLEFGLVISTWGLAAGRSPFSALGPLGQVVRAYLVLKNQSTNFGRPTESGVFGL